MLDSPSGYEELFIDNNKSTDLHTHTVICMVYRLVLASDSDCRCKRLGATMGATIVGRSAGDCIPAAVDIAAVRQAYTVGA